MRVLHLVLAIVVALVFIDNGVAIAAKTALRSDSYDYTVLRGNITSDETDLEERRGVAGGGRGGGGRGEGGRPRVWAPIGRIPVTGDLPPGVYVGPVFGGPHGDRYTDETLVKSGQKVLSITLRSGKRVDAVILTIVNPSGEESTLYHGGGGGDLKPTLALAKGEYITVMEAHEDKYAENDRTRIMYIKFTTNLGNFIDGGTQTVRVGNDSAKDGHQLGGFIGRSGDELDQVGAFWTSIQPVV